MIVNIDMTALSKSAPRTYRTVVKHLDLRQAFGEQDIDLSGLSEFTRGEVLGWLAAQKAKPAPVAELVQPPKLAEPLPPQIDMAEVDAEFQRDLQARADEASAKVRLDQYVAEQGLEASQHNLDAITAWLRQNAKGYLSVAGVDVAIANLGPRGSNVLRFIKVVATPPPPAIPEPAEPTEVLQPWQLPLDATEHQMKKAEVRALKDLVARRRAVTGKYRRLAGGFGSRF